MYTNFNDILNEAYKKHQAIGSFNWYHFETLKGVIEAGEESGMPVIASFGAKYLTNMDLDTAAVLTRNLAEKSSQPVCLHLDHSSSLDTIIKAIRAGFGSVMYDGSALPFEENLANTKYVCGIAHACGVSVEAELGTLAAGARSHEGTAEDRQAYTDPSKAAEFWSSKQNFRCQPRGYRRADGVSGKMSGKKIPALFASFLKHRAQVNFAAGKNPHRDRCRGGPACSGRS